MNLKNDQKRNASSNHLQLSKFLTRDMTAKRLRNRVVRGQGTVPCNRVTISHHPLFSFSLLSTAELDKLTLPFSPSPSTFTSSESSLQDFASVLSVTEFHSLFTICSVSFSSFFMSVSPSQGEVSSATNSALSSSSLLSNSFSSFSGSP